MGWLPATRLSSRHFVKHPSVSESSILIFFSISTADSSSYGVIQLYRLRLDYLHREFLFKEYFKIFYVVLFTIQLADFSAFLAGLLRIPDPGRGVGEREHILMTSSQSCQHGFGCLWDRFFRRQDIFCIFFLLLFFSISYEVLPIEVGRMMKSQRININYIIAFSHLLVLVVCSVAFSFVNAILLICQVFFSFSSMCNFGLDIFIFHNLFGPGHNLSILNESW